MHGEVCARIKAQARCRDGGRQGTGKLPLPGQKRTAHASAPWPCEESTKPLVSPARTVPSVHSVSSTRLSCLFPGPSRGALVRSLLVLLLPRPPFLFLSALLELQPAPMTIAGPFVAQLRAIGSTQTHPPNKDGALEDGVWAAFTSSICHREV